VGVGNVDSSIEQAIAESGSAYLIIDAQLRVRSSGGQRAILDSLQASGGTMLIDYLPELYGSEALLADILAGRLARLRIPEINRDHPNGGTRYLDLLTLPLNAETGRINGLLQMITDVTERGQIEQMRVQQRNELSLLQVLVTQQNMDLARMNAELRRANRLKDEFLAGMSHEVRTPLTAILGLSEILRIGAVGKLSAEQAELVVGIEESGRHLLALINDLLDIAKIEAGRFALERGPTMLRSTCEASIRMLGELATKKGLRVALALDPDVELVLADERRLRQALINLISNAIKFTPAGAEIGLDVRGDTEDEAVYLAVWDRGIGIAADDATRLFQPFSQIERESQRQETGSGLGLVLVAQLIALHGGSVTLESTPSAGSRFTLALPWSRAEQERLHALIASGLISMMVIEEAEQAAPPGATPTGQTILLIDPDQAAGARQTNYLKQCGYQTISAGSSDEALASIRTGVPDLVVLDLRLRELDGIDALQRLRRSVALEHVPIIVLTALCLPGDRERFLAAGASVYLTKPVRPRSLADMVARLLDASPASSGAAG
jgi:signal transduction histidine kinase/ActR/RegA family two-component response regulator